MHLGGNEQVLDVTAQTGVVTSTAAKRVNAYGFDMCLIPSFVAVATLVVASTGWDAATDTITSASHGLKTGMVYQATTSGALPTGISGGTDYFVIYKTDDTFQLATSLANAQAGTAVNFTDSGSGNHTLTQQTDVATYTVQISPDNSSWFVYDAMTAVSVVGITEISKHFETAAAYVRIRINVTKGAANFDGWLISKG